VFSLFKSFGYRSTNCVTKLSQSCTQRTGLRKFSHTVCRSIYLNFKKTDEPVHKSKPDTMHSKCTVSGHDESVLFVWENKHLQLNI